MEQQPGISLQRFVRSIYNAVDYPLRNFFQFRRGTPKLINEPKEDLFRDLPEPDRKRAEDRAQELIRRYRLEMFADRSSRDIFRKNLYYLDLLETALKTINLNLPDPLLAADVGSSHWFYVQGFWSGLSWFESGHQREVELHGYEPDAYRVYHDWRSRYDYARAFLGGLDQVLYHPAPFSSQPGRFDLITQFFPFVYLDDHLAWGLPRRLHIPEELLEDMFASLHEQGALLIVNQGKAEHEQQMKLIDQKLGIVPQYFKFKSLMYSYETPSWVIIFQKRS